MSPSEGLAERGVAVVVVGLRSGVESGMSGSSAMGGSEVCACATGGPSTVAVGPFTAEN